MAEQELISRIKLTDEQQKEGFWVEQSGENILVWHHNNQIALLLPSGDIERKVQEVIEQRRAELKEIEERTGWRPQYKKE
jgi:hypothetical protein